MPVADSRATPPGYGVRDRAERDPRLVERRGQASAMLPAVANARRSEQGERDGPRCGRSFSMTDRGLRHEPDREAVFSKPRAEVDVLSEEDSEAWAILTAWWEEHNMPQGLQLIAIHGQPSLRAWVVELLTEHGNNAPTNEEIVDAALLIDSMIS